VSVACSHPVWWEAELVNGLAKCHPVIRSACGVLVETLFAHRSYTRRTDEYPITGMQMLAL